MLCPNCDHSNPDTAFFCTHCGTMLREQVGADKSKTGRFLVLLAVLATGFALGIFANQVSNPVQKGEPGVSEEVSMPESRTTVTRSAPDEKVLEGRQADPLKGTKTAVSKEIAPPPSGPMAIGLVVVTNPWGGEVSSVPSAIVNGAWVALPTKAVMGGDGMFIRLGKRSARGRVEKGTWRDGDVVSLWMIEGLGAVQSPALRAWNITLPLEWISLDSPGTSLPVTVGPSTRQGVFLLCAIPQTLRKPGVFVQENRIVGWTFGNWSEEGYLWAGPAGNELDYRTTIDNVYDITFANGREEQFARAMAMGENIPDMERLEAFAEGFRLPSKLPPKDRPAQTRKDIVLSAMQSLAARIMEPGAYRRILDVLDEQVLREAGDPQLLWMAMTAASEVYGYESAIDLAEGMREDMRDGEKSGIAEVNRLHSKLYRDWIGSLLGSGEFRAGWWAFTRGRSAFPEDLDIHLLGVELALAEGDWVEAERLLRMKEYPRSLADKVRLFALRIAEFREEEGKIVISFAPGAKRIPVSAVLNGRFEQEFVIDTGASMVTIPSSTAEMLGIKMDSRNPVRRISTVNGVKTGREVLIGSIMLGDWEVNDVAALVIDIPDRPELGLLGLNFLNQFHMEINHDRGVLFLTPR